MRKYMFPHEKMTYLKLDDFIKWAYVLQQVFIFFNYILFKIETWL